METVIEGKLGRGRGRLHVSPEGMTLLDQLGEHLGSADYGEVADVAAQGGRGGSRLIVTLTSGALWRLDGLHPLQARYGTELIREQLGARARRGLPLFSEKQILTQIRTAAQSLLSGSTRGVVDYLDFLLFQAALHGVSDVHLEPNVAGLQVRFRLDGALIDVAELPTLWQPRLMARLKVLAELEVYRSDLPQEGRFALRLSDRTVDCRTTLLPTLHGEKAVIRLFDSTRALRELGELGMAPDVLSAWMEMLDRPQGLLLLTGPSNHGKTTTLYASLRHLHSKRRDLSSLCTVEDPIEHDLRVINQTQVNAGVGLTFAQGLRTVLRQDPEVIMVGEIRDEETAEIAVRAGLTGHLILSSVHASSAAGVFPRLVDLGCPAFLVASSVAGVMAQRLVRLVCSECRIETALSDEARSRWNLTASAGLWVEGSGCHACGFTGYRGRTGLFELLAVDEALRQGVISGRSPVELSALAGSGVSLAEHGLSLAKAGRTSLAELERVLGAPAACR